MHRFIAVRQNKPEGNARDTGETSPAMRSQRVRKSNWCATRLGIDGEVYHSQSSSIRGACASVMPTDWRPHVGTTSTFKFRAKDFFRVANGHDIYNEGHKVVIMMTREGNKRDMKFSVCDVSKVLGSASPGVQNRPPCGVQPTMGRRRVIHSAH